ncbi:MAG: RNA ligase [Methanosarcinaceae archaeon]|nr:RNA ligase [Methanosarcinaceae archaeon]
MHTLDSKTDVVLDGAAEYLNMPHSRLQELVDKRDIRQNWGEYQHLFRFDTTVAGIQNGSVLYQRNGNFELIRGFPKIRRAMLLEPAVHNHFSTIDSVVVEEKMNGYNIRVVSIDDHPVAITRSGYICPYSTEKAKTLLDASFFHDHPDLVLHGEMVGPDNPYVPKDIYDIESLEFFVFDIRKKGTGEPYPIKERRRLASEYNFTQVHHFGEFSTDVAPEKIQQIIQDLGAIEHEGVMIKDPEMIVPPIKYTCSQSNCGDLRHAFKFYNEVGRDYLFSRVVREGFQAVEWNEGTQQLDERCLRLGKSIIYPMMDTIRHIGEGERIADNVQIRVRDLDTVDKFKEYLRRLGVDAIFSAPKRIGDEYLLSIKKPNRSTNDKTDAILKGDLW